MMFLKIKNDAGFSMVELMIVIAIIAILATVGYMSFDLVRNQQVSSAAKELLATLQRTRVDAMSQGPTDTITNKRGTGIRLVSVNAYITFKFDDCNEDYKYDIDTCTGSTREEAEALTNTISSSLGLKRLSGTTLVNPANVTASDILIFDRLGQPRDSSWGIISNMSMVIIHNQTSYKRCIIVRTNKIREGSWNEAAGTCTEQ